MLEQVILAGGGKIYEFSDGVRGFGESFIFLKFRSFFRLDNNTSSQNLRTKEHGNGNGGGWGIDWKQRTGSLIPQQFDGRCLLEDQHKSVGEKHGSECWQVCRVLHWWLVGRSLPFLLYFFFLSCTSFFLYLVPQIGTLIVFPLACSPCIGSCFRLHSFISVACSASAVYGKALQHSVGGRFGGQEPGGAQDGQGYSNGGRTIWSDYMVHLLHILHAAGNGTGETKTQPHWMQKRVYTMRGAKRISALGDFTAGGVLANFIWRGFTKWHEFYVLSSQPVSAS